MIGLLRWIKSLPDRWNHLRAFDKYPRLIRQFQALNIEPDWLVIYPDRVAVSREAMGLLGTRPWNDMENDLTDDWTWFLMPYPRIGVSEPLSPRPLIIPKAHP